MSGKLTTYLYLVPRLRQSLTILIHLHYNLVAYKVTNIISGGGGGGDSCDSIFSGNRKR